MTNREAIAVFLDKDTNLSTSNCNREAYKLLNSMKECAIKALEENDKLKADIEQLRSSRNIDKEYYSNEIQSLIKNHKIEVEHLKSELEQSVKLPCKVGDKLFSTENGYIEEFKVRSLNHIVNLVEFSRFDETVFFTKEEAEQSLKGGAE